MILIRRNVYRTRAKEKLFSKESIIHRPGKHLHRTKIAVQGMGKGDLMQFSRVLILDNNLKPTYNSMCILSTEILPVDARTAEEELKDEIRGLKRQVRDLQKGQYEPRPKKKTAEDKNDRL